jgi:tricorn protease interacting factor F2/3
LIYVLQIVRTEVTEAGLGFGDDPLLDSIADLHRFNFDQSVLQHLCKNRRHFYWGGTRLEFLIRTAPGYFGDSLRSTHAVQLEIRDSAEISQSVDEITYFKGANIVRMIETFLGAEVFRKGVAAYLERFQYGNARGEDLWEALEAASDQPVRRVMLSWVERPGLPVLSVDHEGETLRLRQRRFSFLPSEGTEPPWPIPLILRVNGISRPTLFDQPSIEISVGSPETLVVNPGRTAFLRAWYQTGLRDRMISRLAALDAVDRCAFLNDAAAFVPSGD